MARGIVARTCPFALTCPFAFTCLLAVSAALADQSPDAAFEPEAIRFFEAEVRPLLLDHCVHCHGGDTQEAGLRLDSRSAVIRGTDYGPVVKPGESEPGRLLLSVRHESDQPMPEGEDKLSDEQIAVLERWVAMGLPWPDETPPDGHAPTRDPSRHWAFQPIADPSPPAIPAGIDPGWAHHPIDHFIAERLAAAGMTPSPQAPREVLIRRLHHTLTGLPPSYDEVRRFVEDRDPLAYERLVERLLETPQFGERWARHWLDVARYADTKGYLAGGVERKFPFSFTYRDWVTDAFNEDLPYDDFLRYQIAADYLVEHEGHDRRHLAALGFLTLGRRFLNREPDIIDDRIDVVTRGTMGLTVSCARCHDHKFDPIPTQDYYSLYGVFSSSTEPEELPLIGEPEPGPRYEAFLQELRKREGAVEDFLRERVVAATSAGGIAEYFKAAHAAWDGGRDAVNAEASARKLHDALLVAWIEFLKGQPREPAADEPAPFAAWLRLREADPDDGAWADAIGRLAGAGPTETATETPSETDKVDSGPPSDVVGLYRHLRQSPPESIEALADLYGEFLHRAVVAPGESTAAGAGQGGSAAEDETAGDETAGDRSAGRASAPKTADWARRFGRGSGSPLDLDTARMRRLLFRGDRNQLRQLDNQIVQLYGTHPGAPPRAMALVDKPQPHDVPVFIRGNPGRRGDVAPRRFLAVLSDDPQRRPAFDRGSGRRDLAEAIVSPENPLTARVIVNRVWMHHFGQPLVETPSDFGVMADEPEHRELLDFLAARLIASGWSLKSLHRDIVLSATYRQRSDLRPEYADIDPDNRRYARMNRQRLDFEALRDGILAVTGHLDATLIGGRPVSITDSPTPPRRTLYAFIDRQNLPGVFRTFDFANPDLHSPRRHATSVPQQALFMMNSPMVIGQVRRLVESDAFQQQATPERRVRWLVRRVFARDAEPHEVDLALEFLGIDTSPETEAGPVKTEAGPAEAEPGPSEPPGHSWDQYVLVLFGSNEFAFID